MYTNVIAFVLAYKEPPTLSLHSLLFQELNSHIKLDIVIVAAYDSACQISSEIINGFAKSPNKKLVKCLVVKVPHSEVLEIGERVGFSLSLAMKIFDISRYDYILKLDDDVYLPKDFIKCHINASKELIGRGCAVLIKSSTYIELFNHSWPINVLDDFIVIYSIETFKRTRVMAWRYIKQPLFLRPEIKVDIRRWLKTGFDYFVLGFHPLYMLFYTLKQIIRPSRGISVFSKFKYIFWRLVLLIGYTIAACKLINKRPIWYYRLIRESQIHLIKRKMGKLIM